MRNWQGVAISIIVLAFEPQALWGQAERSAPAFEVASVKRLPPPISGRVMTGGGPGTPDPNRLTRSNVTLGSVIMEAFAVQGRLIAGPEWLSSERYEIIANIPPGSTRSDIPLMLQGLLVQRFGLQFHREQKSIKGYALAVGRNGVKIKLSTNSPAPISGRDGFPDLPEGIARGAIKIDSVGAMRRTAAGAMSMPKLADYLAGQLDVPVTDSTQLSGNYDIVLYYTKTQLTTKSPAVPSGDTGPDLTSAVKDQLGLELRAQAVTVDQLVVDRINKTPSPN
jgi:uncharacterized protein (TIGR03435 family)